MPDDVTACRAELRGLLASHTAEFGVDATIAMLADLIEAGRPEPSAAESFRSALCPRCGGSGRYCQLTYGEDDEDRRAGRSRPSYEMVECVLCLGTGCPAAPPPPPEPPPVPPPPPGRRLTY